MDTDTQHISAESTLKELHAYAKLLFLRSGRQFEDRVLYQELEEELSLDESSTDGKSSKNVPLGNLDTDRLGREFLDRLSETISAKKGGRHVVASYMFYWPDKVKVLIAINLGFAEGDVLSKFLDNLCISLKGIAVAPDNETEKHMDTLWNMLLRHQYPRLQAAIVDLRRIMKNFEHLLPQRFSSQSTHNAVLPHIDGVTLGFENCLKLLAQLLFGDNDSDLQRHDSLVTLSHALYRNFPADKFQALGPQGKFLRREIGFLGRLRTSFKVLVAAATQLSGFGDLSLIPVVKPKTRKELYCQEWSPAKTFRALNIELSDAAVGKLMNSSNSKVKWTKNKLIIDFCRLSSPTREVHAEAQLIAFTLSNPDEIANGKRFDYIGCSRLLDYVQDEETSRVEAQDETFEESTKALCPFCNEKCERKMPLSHLLKCNMRQVTSADYLYQDVLEDIVPTDPQVRQDYWLDRCQTSHEESHLLGLFAGLLRYHRYPITREELHQWRSDLGGNAYLVTKIVEKFEELPKGSTGGYFPWFLRHRKRFELTANDKSIPHRPGPERQLQNMQDKARKYLAPEDQNKDFNDLSPFSKMHYFAFYGITIVNSYPPPMNLNSCYWFDFGFVVCQDRHEEETLSRMYNTMLFGSLSRLEYEESLQSSIPATFTEKKDPACTFDEFWEAWEKRDLMTIFSRCWPGSTTQKPFRTAENNILGRLRVFIEAEAPRPSIWKLRHFLAIDDISVESAVAELAEAAKDYGFSETLDTRTTIELKEFYMKLFKEAEPLEIHTGRMEGILLQFAERHVDGTTLRVKKVLQSLQSIALKWR
ncbi:zf-mynd domain-containing protein [Fusarium globosum]|uniref:Zf-mynd domain-containing protein n=1 Tax=Fusarium globosum TaxID=78864 RepID=A0A8H5YVK6_9HYPO|nr:zf-mynd domain-containing protein [Fusarium globosum]